MESCLSRRNFELIRQKFGFSRKSEGAARSVRRDSGKEGGSGQQGRREQGAGWADGGGHEGEERGRGQVGKVWIEWLGEGRVGGFGSGEHIIFFLLNTFNWFYYKYIFIFYLI